MAKDQEIKKLIEESGKIREKNFGREINFYYTGKDYPAISLTGPACELSCKHCRKKLISRLEKALTPDELIQKCIELEKKGARGMLLTGGCDREGSVPLRKFLPAVKELKEDTNLKITAHTGILDASTAKKIRDSDIDGVCVDVVGSEEVTKKVYGVAIKPERYRKTLSALEEAGIESIAPHVCVGLDYGKTGHEMAALEIIKSIDPENIVIIGLTDLSGTPMEGIKISPNDYVEVVCRARLMFPEAYVSCGCARGKGNIRSEIDALSVQAGANSIAIPTSAAYAQARKMGLKIKEYRSCCSLVPSQLR